MVLAMGASFGLGALAAEGLHAQAKPPGYIVVEVNLKDPDKYRTEFIPPAQKAIQEDGGSYVVRGGRALSFTGAPPESRIIVLKFDSMEKAQAWWDSSGRKDSQAIGNKYASFRVYAVEGFSP